jgi:hypothetical protein
VIAYCAFKEYDREVRKQGKNTKVAKQELIIATKRWALNCISTQGHDVVGQGCIEHEWINRPQKRRVARGQRWETWY